MKSTPLPHNGTIAVIAPSSRGTPDGDGVKLLETRGYHVQIHTQNDLSHHQSAGTPAQRAAAVMDVFKNKDIHAVMAARGGNRSMHILPLLDYAAIVANPKPLIGFSDSTALLNAVTAQTGMATYHGPTLSRLSKAQPHELDQMFAALSGQSTTLDWTQAQTVCEGRAQGKLIGGNLSVFAALAGTPYMPDATGAILFLEDIGDQMSRYDRMLAQLGLAGILEKLSGIVFGQMLAEGDSSVTPFGFTLEDIIREHTAHLGIPVLMNAPFGHSGPLCTLPIGGMATLDAHAKALQIH